jgi:phage replication O-like protein O
MTGFTKLDNDLLEVMSKSKFNGTQFRILITVWRNTFGWQQEEKEMSLTFIAKATGTHKKQIEREINKLIEMKVITIAREATFSKPRVIKFNENIGEWIVDSDSKSRQGTKKRTPNEKDGSTVSGLATSTVSELATSPVSGLAPQERKNKEILKESSKERESSSASTNVSLCFQFYESNVGMLSPIHREEMLHYFDDFNGDGEVLIEAMKIACDRDKKNFGFVKWLLNHWLNANAKTIDAVKAYEVSKFNSSQSKGQSVQKVSQRPSHWKKPERLTEEERKEMAELEAQMPF